MVKQQTGRGRRFRSMKHLLADVRAQLLETQYEAYAVLDASGCLIACGGSIGTFAPGLAAAAPGTHYTDIPGLTPYASPLCEETIELVLSGQNGEKRHLRVRITLPEYSRGKSAVCLLARDVTAAKQLEYQLERARWHDELTGLWAEETFFHLAQQAYATLSHLQAPAALLLLAPEALAALGRQHGLLCEQKAMAHIAALMVKNLRPSAIAGTCAGGLFGLLLPGENAQTACDIAGQLAETIRAHSMRWQGQAVPLHVSIGVAVLDVQRHSSFEALYEEARAALYTVQAIGGNSIFLGGPRGKAAGE